MRDIVFFQCSDCKRTNYSSTKNKRKHNERLETKKFCKFCRQHKVHKEVK